ncbi:hypothetical protein B0H17DRAFT_514847 [Mycena rosella]|uniref:Uncharacterized protein n=1 Tax=Mycena rosella TaxID=1033263 RepID=A0AAD7GXI2_MYCRO|nr:hypothetical protein B0H17DRAFT_514847 [Mycena rosella]
MSHHLHIPSRSSLILNRLNLKSPCFAPALEDTERKIGAIDEECLRAQCAKLVNFATTQKAGFSPLRRLPSGNILVVSRGHDRGSRSLLLACPAVDYIQSVPQVESNSALNTQPLECGPFLRDYGGPVHKSARIAVRFGFPPAEVVGKFAIIAVYNDPPPETILKLLLTVSNRWGDATISLGPSAIHAFRRFNGTFSLLREFDLTCYGERLALGDTFEALPLLEALTLYGFPEDLKLPYGQLKKCQLTGVQSKALCLLQ